MLTLLNPQDVRWIILHCSASLYGDVATFDSWHKDRGFDSIGYHWVVTNCYPTEEHFLSGQPDLAYDGMIQRGRPEKFKGAHARGHNWESVGVVMTGMKGTFTSKQLYSAAKLCSLVSLRFPHIEAVKGHCEFTDQKTCPELDMDNFRKWIQPKGVVEPFETFVWQS